MQILEKLGALRKKTTPRIIDDVEFNFYPVRIKRILTGTTREILEPISEALQVIMRPRNADEKILEEQCIDGTVARAREPISLEMAQFRAQERQQAMQAAMKALFADDTRYKLARLIMDSLRDDCPAEPSDAEVRDFVDAPSMDITVFVEFVKGFMAANTAIFGDLGNLIRERINQAVERMTADPEADHDDAPEQPQQEAETDANLRTLQDESGVPQT